MNEILDTLIRIVEQQSPGMLASILQLEDDGIHVRHISAPSLPKAYVEAIDGEAIGPVAGACGTAAVRRETVIVEDVATDPLFAGYCGLALEHGLRACWSTPIFDETHRVLGTFAMYFRRPGRPNRKHRTQVGIVTNTAAVAILKKKWDDELRVRETQVADAQQIAHFGSFEWLPETDTVHWTEELFRIFGLEPGAFQPSFEHYLERIHPEDREAIRDMIHQSFRCGMPFEGKESILRPDGSMRVLHPRPAALR